jgi:hypothetical protein
MFRLLLINDYFVNKRVADINFHVTEPKKRKRVGIMFCPWKCSTPGSHMVHLCCHAGLGCDAVDDSNILQNTENQCHLDTAHYLRRIHCIYYLYMLQIICIECTGHSVILCNFPASRLFYLHLLFMNNLFCILLPTDLVHFYKSITTGPVHFASSCNCFSFFLILSRNSELRFLL